MHTERVEFVDSEVPGGGAEDLVTTGGPDGDRRPGGRGLVLVGAAVTVLLAALLVGRLVAGDGPGRATVVATPSAGLVGRPSTPVTRPVFGLIGLPRAIGSPREMVTTRTGDVVWMLDQGSGIVRIENGSVTAVQLLESQATAIAVNPDGSRLYVATAANRPALQILDATTLAPGTSRPLEGSIQALAVSSDAVWAATGSELLRLDLDSLQPLGTVVLPGVVLTSHLRIDDDSVPGGQEVLTGLVTGSTGNAPTATRLLRVDTLTQQVGYGATLPGEVQAATGQLLTWVSYRPAADEAPFTAGYDNVVSGKPQAVAAPPLVPGSRIYDGGGGYAAFLVVAPHSSVVGCRDPGGFPTSEVDVAPAVPDAVIVGPVVRTDTAFYVNTDRGLVRQGVGACP